MKPICIAARLALLYGTVHAAPPASFCHSVAGEISRSNAQSAATSFCSSRVASKDKTTTVTVTRSTTTTKTASATVTRTIEYTSTNTALAFSTVTSGSSSTTVFLTTTLILPNPSYSCFSFATPTPATELPAENDATTPSWTPAWKGRTLTSACECILNPFSTKTVTKTKTSTFTHYHTETSTSVVSQEASSIALTTTTSIVTVLSTIYAKTVTSTRTATAGPDVTFRISLHYPSAVATEKPIYMAPLIDNVIGQVLFGEALGYGDSIFDLTLTEQCVLFSPFTGTSGRQNQGDEPDFVHFDSGDKPVKCQIDMSKTPHRTICQNPFGGNITSVFSYYTAYDNTYYYPLFLGNTTGNESGLQTGPAKLYAMFESND